MIISASRRTDIPAFFSDWFFNRLEEGYVVNQNPFNANQLSKIRLDSEVVDAIVFWTKNAIPLFKRIGNLDDKGLFYYFQYTINPYGKDTEIFLPKDKTKIIDNFKRISSKIGPERMIWRYDPIFFSNKYNLDFHKCAFEKCASLLQGNTKNVVISFLDMDYNNTKKIEFSKISDGNRKEKNELASYISETASSFGMTVQSCAEEIDLKSCNIEHGCCIDANLIERMTGRKLSSRGHKKDRNQRSICGCVESVDIGVYNTCKHGCIYCYANYSPETIETNLKKHDVTSPLLLGECDAESIPFKKDQKSFFEAQETLF